jgi:tetratricopeptide (TPR) repeat protein
MQTPPRKSAFAGALALGLALSANAPGQSESTSSLLIKTEPGAIIWVDSLRYGVASASGELTINNLPPGARAIRARLKGKHEVARKIVLAAGTRQSFQISFPAPASKAELAFQTAEELREKGNHAEAIKEYRAAIKLSPGAFPAARVGLARSLMSSQEYDDAIAEARRALRERGGLFPEAYTVIANIKRAQGFYDDALDNYRKALAQAHGVSPEAHTGLALVYQERNRPEDAIKHFRLAIAQANDTEPIIYFLLGNTLEREFLNKEAVEAYEKYLQLDPTSRQASAVRSVLRQLKREIR